MSKIVIALGGNALGNNPEEQLSLLEGVAKIIVNLVKDGNQIVLTHGDGPQVGQILLAMEYASNGEVKTPSMPFPECGSMSQGYIGYQLQQCIQDELERQKIKKNCATLITQVLVDKNDSAFENPTNPIGAFYTEEEAKKYIEEGHFAKGSMLPKIDACISFVENTTDKVAIISSLEKASEALKGETGTIIKG